MKKALCCFLCLTLIISLAGCDFYGMIGYYPEEKCDRWYCETLNFELYYVRDESGILIEQTYPLTWNGITYEVYISTFVAYFDMSYDADSDVITTDEEFLIRGE